MTSLVIAGAACSSDGGTGVTTPHPTSAPTSSSALALGTQGSITCTAANDAIPGTYASIYTEGTVSGNTYMQGTGNSEYGIFTTFAYTASPVPSPTPIVIPSVAPTAPGAMLEIVYYGEYSIPTTAGLTTAPTNGCFEFETAQPIDPQASPAPFEASGQGQPEFAPTYPTGALVLEGAITSFTISNLTRTSGTGSFTLNTNLVGNAQGGGGTVVITGSTAFYGTYVLIGSAGRQPTMIRRR